MSGNRRLVTTLALAVSLGLIAVSDGLVWPASRKWNPGLSYVLRWESAYAAVGFGIGILLFRAYVAIEKRLGGRELVLAAAALCCVSGLAWRIVAALVRASIGLNPFRVDAGLFLRGSLIDGVTLGLLSFVYFGVGHWREAVEQKEMARQASALAQQAQLQMLHYQLNPHFLFNVLNSIRGMILEDPVRSRQMVTELADFLRYSLSHDGQETSLGEELHAIENYLAIQRIRFEDQLDATVQAADEARGVAVPCFLIQPLVENAVKHGMKTSGKPLRVRIEVTRAGEEVGIVVANTGRLLAPTKGSDPAEGAGIGVQNTTERLDLAFPGRHSFRITEAEGWVRAEVRLRLAVR